MLLYQTNPVGVQLFSYVNTFFCHVGEPNQSCGSSTLFLCNHFLLLCWCTRPILWEFNSFLMSTLSFVPINLYGCSARECILFFSIWVSEEGNTADQARNKQKMTGGGGGWANSTLIPPSPPASVPRLKHTSWYMSDHYSILLVVIKDYESAFDAV